MRAAASVPGFGSFRDVYGYSVDRGAVARSREAQSGFSPWFESGWDTDALHLRAILPGVTPTDVNVNLQGNQLMISGERKQPEGFPKNGYTQLTYGKFTTSVTLPPGLDTEKVTCNLHDGILDIQIPVAESMKPRQIPVNAGAETKAIGA